jgi:2-methylaconitate cis-trans-isomerase PrpF
MMQHAIPFLMMRGGTSRGLYFARADLPAEPARLARVLIAALGAGHPYNIDGLGGGVAVTTKVAMLSRSTDPEADIDYFFAQVSVNEERVDFKPTCGNILSGVGPAAIEMGMITATEPVTRVRIRAVNTGALVDAVIQTLGGRVVYDGDLAIDGVPRRGAPIRLGFRETVGAATGQLLPTGQARDRIDGVEVTCLDVAMPVVIARAEAFGLTGAETAAELDADTAFIARREAIRVKAGALMGMGDVSASVTPKFALMARARQGGTASARYFMPQTCHPSMAVTGAQCLAASLLVPGSVTADLAPGLTSPADLVLEHPSGRIEVTVEFTPSGGEAPPELHTAGILRTARLLARGEVLVPASALS